MKNTLQSLLIHHAAPYMVDGVVHPSSYRETIRSLHTDAVTRAVSSYPDNSVLECSAPPVAEEEGSLPRPLRSVLS